MNIEIKNQNFYTDFIPKYSRYFFKKKQFIKKLAYLRKK